jgi:hypothetical protein
LTIIVTILNKVIAKEFYRANASFFLVTIGICCGFMSKIEHMALAEFFVSSVTTLFIPLAFWLIYSFKIIEFNRRVISLDQNEFILRIHALSFTSLLSSLLTVALTELLPMIVYGFFLFAIALRQHDGGIMITLILMMAIIISFVTFSLYRNITKPGDNNTEWRITQLLNRTFHRSYLQISLGWMMRNEFFLLVGNKIFSVLIIIGAASLYKFDTYDLRLMAMGITVAMTGHAMLIYRYHHFTENIFSFVRNMPFTLAQRIWHFCKVFLIICLPDFGVLIKNFPGQLSQLQLAESLFLAAGIVMIIFSWLYLKSINAEKLITQSFVFALAVIVLVLFSVNVWLLGIIFILISIVIYFRRYYQFALVSDNHN